MKLEVVEVVVVVVVAVLSEEVLLVVVVVEVVWLVMVVVVVVERWLMFRDENCPAKIHNHTSKNKIIMVLEPFFCLSTIRFRVFSLNFAP